MHLKHPSVHLHGHQDPPSTTFFSGTDLVTAGGVCGVAFSWLLAQNRQTRVYSFLYQSKRNGLFVFVEQIAVVQLFYTCVCVADGARCPFYRLDGALMQCSFGFFTRFAFIFSVRWLMPGNRRRRRSSLVILANTQLRPLTFRPTLFWWGSVCRASGFWTATLLRHCFLLHRRLLDELF